MVMGGKAGMVGEKVDDGKESWEWWKGRLGMMGGKVGVMGEKVDDGGREG